MTKRKWCALLSTLLMIIIVNYVVRYAILPAQIAWQVHWHDQISLNSLTWFPWDKVYILPPYTPRKYIDSVTNGDWRAKLSQITMSDGHYLFVFMLEGRVVTAFDYQRGSGDFKGVASHSPYSPESSFFLVQKELEQSGKVRYNVVKKPAANQKHQNN